MKKNIKLKTVFLNDWIKMLSPHVCKFLLSLLCIRRRWKTLHPIVFIMPTSKVHFLFDFFKFWGNILLFFLVCTLFTLNHSLFHKPPFIVVVFKYKQKYHFNQIDSFPFSFCFSLNFLKKFFMRFLASFSSGPFLILML